MDDLLDLSFNSTSGSSSTAPKKTAFDYLASPSYGRPSSAASTKSSSAGGGASTSSRAGTPSQPLKSGTQAVQPNGSSNDAFAALFGPSSSSSAASTAKMTMAQRLEQQRSPPTAVSQAKKDDTWDFDLLSTTKPSPPVAKQPVLQSPTPVHARQDSFDLLDGFTQPSSAPAQKSSAAATKGPTAFESNDFSMDAFADEDDDLLAGMPSRPEPRAEQAARPSPVPRARANGARPPSPPPHILGQLIEMGYSIPAAQSALEATYDADSGGWNAQRAIEMLVEQDQVQERARQAESEARLVREGAFDSSRGPTPDVGRRHRDQPSRRRDDADLRDERQAHAHHRSSNRDRSDPSADLSRDKIGAAAEQLVAQASSFGLSVFKSANAYWESGRAQVQKKLNELDLAGSSSAMSGSSSQDRRKPGRPKWMTDAPDDFDETKDDAREQGFRDDRERPAPARSSARARQELDSGEPMFSFDDDRSASSSAKPIASAAASYKSPFRRNNQRPQHLYAASPPSSSTSPSPRNASPAPVPPSAPRRTVKRSISPVSPDVLARASALREKGNEAFKLGQYGSAAEAYSAALELIPAKHLRRVPLLNNHASALAKTGDERAVLETTTEVISIVTCDSAYDVGELEDEAVEEVRPKEAWGKAMSRRAKALEGVEKWREASEAWSSLLGKGDMIVRAAGGPKAVAEGRERCRKILEPSPSSRSTPVARPASKSPAASTNSNTAAATGKAVNELRRQNAAAAAEEDQRLALVDTVEARIQAWKGGKETNLRALIASLDTVLWPELGWKKVGLNELLTENQLKSRYMRAVAKLHPDKLGNATVEQKMVAGSVFAALNEAWNTSR